MLGLASCSEKAKNDEAAAAIEELKAQIEAGDASSLSATLENAVNRMSELVAENPEAAKTYVAQIQEFVKENQEKINAVVGENEVTKGLIETLVGAPADVLVNTLNAGSIIKENAENLKDSVDQAINDKINELQEGAENTVNDQIDAAKQKAADQVNAAKQEAVNKTNEATQKVNDEVNKAAEKANQEVNDAAKKALKSVGL